MSTSFYNHLSLFACASAFAVVAALAGEMPRLLAKTEVSVPISDDDKLTLSLSVDTSHSGRVGEVSHSIILMKVSNYSDTLWCYSADCYQRGLVLTVTDSVGNVLPPNEQGKQLAVGLRRSYRRLVNLDPGSFDQNSIVLDHYFDLQPMQTYTVALEWTFTGYLTKSDFENHQYQGGVELHARCDPITLTVTKRRQ